MSDKPNSKDVSLILYSEQPLLPIFPMLMLL